LSSRRFQPAVNEAEGVAPTPTGFTPQSGPYRGRRTFSLSFRGFHPAGAGLLIVCPSGAMPTVTPVEELDVSLLSYRTSEITLWSKHDFGCNRAEVILIFCTISLRWGEL